jgi:hypothetical protein
MKLEDQVAPLALAQLMMDQGFPQETCYAWWDWPGMPDPSPTVQLQGSPPWRAEAHPRGHVLQAMGIQLCAAPTVAEMGEWMPSGFNAHAIAPTWRSDPRDAWAAASSQDPDGYTVTTVTTPSRSMSSGSAGCVTRSSTIEGSFPRGPSG